MLMVAVHLLEAAYGGKEIFWKFSQSRERRAKSREKEGKERGFAIRSSGVGFAGEDESEIFWNTDYKSAFLA